MCWVWPPIDVLGVTPPGLTLEQATDLRTLKRELDKLEKQLRELSLTHRTRYLPKDITDQLKEQLAAKVTLRDELLEQTDVLKIKRKKLKGMINFSEPTWSFVKCYQLCSSHRFP